MTNPNIEHGIGNGIIGSREPLALVGIGCRFPGGADDPEGFWRVITQGIDVFTDIPADRWDVRSHYDPDPTRKGKSYVRQGAFVRQPFDRFDAAFFGISPREARGIDPSQRLLLEVAWEAFEDAGIVPASVAGSTAGVFVGGFLNDMTQLVANPMNRALLEAASSNGISLTMLSERLSYFLDLRGPSVSVDTACSSSLVAFHQACSSVWSGEASMALAGGATLMLCPETTIALCKGGFLSPDARCKPFDARANGYARGEGAGIVIIKRLSDALADRNPIHALVLGTACNQDGRTDGITVPRAASQVALIRQACAQAGIDPAQIQYVEAHGTGTAVGDPIEASALGEALSRGRAATRPCVIGSVKSVIGHTEAAAGIAGVIKTALCLQRREIPGNLQFVVPNPAIDFDGLRLRVAAQREPWPAHDGAALAGVNSFGFGGTNAHAVLAAAPPIDDDTGVRAPSAGAYLVPLSAHSEAALRDLASAWRDYTAPGGAGAHHALADLARSAGAHRTHFAHRLAIVAESVDELHAQLEAFLAGITRPGLLARRARAARPRVCFVYSGMGPQWWAMGRELLQSEPVFRDVVGRCSAALEPRTGWSLLELLAADQHASRMAETQVAQTANFALQAGLAALWASWGVRPDAVLGHSVGEVAAAYASGALEFDDAMRVGFHRSRTQARMAGRGQMLATGLAEADVQSVLQRWSSRISLAAVNSPNGTTLAGDPDAIAELARELDARGVFQRVLRVDIAYHSHHMDGLREDLVASLRELSPQTPRLPLFSTVTAAAVTGADLDAEYWWRNVREPVRFAAAIERALDHGSDVLVEIGPHPVLAGAMTEVLDATGRSAEVVSSLVRGKPERRRLLEGLAALYTLGCEVDWAGVAPTGRFVRLPLYPWQREVHWAESAASRASRLGPQGHPLLGHRVSAPEPTWEAELGPAFVPYAEDHRVEDTPVLPGAAYVEVALAADRELGGAGLLEDLRIHSPLLLPRADPPRFRVTVEASGERFAVHSREQDEAAPWRLHASGRRVPGGTLGEPAPLDLAAIRARCREGAAPDAFYAMLQADRGLTYGPGFRAVRALYVGQDEALAELETPTALGDEADAYGIHPALLDASFHAFFALLPEGHGTYLPVAIESVRYHARPTRRLFCHSTRSAQSGDTFVCDVRLCDEHGRVAMEVRGLTIKRLDHSDAAGSVDALYCTPRWVAMDLAAAAPPTGATWLVLVDRWETGEALRAAARDVGIEVLVAERSDGFDRLSSAHFRVRPDDPGDLARLVAAVAAAHPSLGCVVDLWRAEVGLDPARPARTACAGVERALLAQVGLARALRDAVWAHAPRLWVVVRGAEPVVAAAPTDPAQAALAGLTRVLRSEASALRCSLVDLDPRAPTSAEVARALVREFATDAAEDMVALRDGQRYVQRMEPGVPEALVPRRVVGAGTTAFRLEAYPTADGRALHWREIGPPTPGAGEVLVRVNVAAVAAPTDAGGATAGSLATTDLCGIVEAVGAEVEGLAPGESVVALCAGAPASRVVLAATQVAACPRSAARPGVATLLSAIELLVNCARLRAGQTVLVHGASTALGQSLLTVAQAARARVIAATTQREGLDALAGRRDVACVDARVSNWSDAVLDATGGRGVDVVVDVLGRDPRRCAAALAPGGRLLMVRSPSASHGASLGLPLAAGQSVFVFDPAHLFDDRPDERAGLLRETLPRIVRRELPLPALREFALDGVAQAASHLSVAEPVGGAALYFAGLTTGVAPEARALFRADASYLVTGGLRGLGLEIARWMVEQGARTLVLAGRTGASTDEARSGVATLERLGARVVTAALDVSDEGAVRELVARIGRELPPLRGLIHSAVVIDDCNIDDVTAERLHSTFGSKAQGAWNLHLATLELPLEHFVLMSSAVAFFGPVGQASYVAANAFLDGLAHHRHDRGLPALAASWGIMSETGLAARMRNERKLHKTDGWYGWKEMKLGWLTPALGRMLASRAAQVGFFDVDGDTAETIVPYFWTTPRLQKVLATHPRRAPGGQRSVASFGNELTRASLERRQELAREILHALAAEVLGMERQRLDVATPLASFGLDSLMAGQLKVMIERATGATLPAVHIVGGPSVNRLTELVVERLAAIAAQTEVASAASEAARPPRDHGAAATTAAG